MAFRINKGIFQFNDGKAFRNKFKITESGEMVEINDNGDVTAEYMRIGDKATDADKLDGVTSASFLRSDADDTLTASLVMGTQQAIKANNFGHGVYGRYDSYRYQHVWGMGTSWHMAADGTNLGNFYGLAYTHTNIGGESKSGLSHQTLFVENGSVKTAIGRGVWTDGTITATGNANISGNLDIGGAVVGTSSGVALAVGGTSKHGINTSDNARNQLVVSANYYPHLVIAADLNNNINHGAVISMVGTEGTTARQWNMGISNQNPFLFSIGYNRTGDNNPHYGLGDNWSNDDNNHARLSIDRDGNTKIRGSLYVNGTKGGITTGSKVATESYAATLATQLHEKIDGEVIPYIDTKQDAGNYATFTNNIYLNNSTTTANFITQLANLGAFQDNYKAFKVAWSYAGNSNLDVGFESVELAGCLIECWGGTYKHVRLTRPTTGTGGRSIYVYNDQGSTYAPGWRQIWTSDEFGQGNINNWNTAHGWGNHAGLYDAAGEAQGVNTRIDDEIIPTIAAAQSTADTAVAKADTAQGDATKALQGITAVGDAADAAQATADSKLGATAKAADSNLLDGVDSSRFVYGGNSTKTTNVSSVSTALASGFYDGYNITGTPTGTWYTYINMRHNNAGNNYGSQIAVSFYDNADMYVRTISNGTYQGWSKIWNSANFNPADAIAHTDTRIDNEVIPEVTKNATNIARNATDIATKAALGGSYGQDFAADDMRVDQWFRNTASGKGLYNEATTQHFYSDDDDYWNIAGGTGANGIRFRDEHAGTIRGYIYANNSNEVGFLDAGGSWAIKHTNDNGTRFYTDNTTLEFSVGRDTIGASFGTVRTHTTLNGWGGYSIAGRVVFMHDHSNGWGIYNDVNNEWMIYGTLNGQVELKYNNSTKLATNNGGVTVTGTVSATAFSGDGSGLTGITAPVDFTNQPNNTTSQLASITFDGRGLIFTMADGSAFSLDGARPL